LHVKAHYEIRCPELLNQRLCPALRVVVIGHLRGAVGNGCGQPQLGNVLASTDLIQGALRLQVKVDDVDGLCLRSEMGERPQGRVSAKQSPLEIAVLILTHIAEATKAGRSLRRGRAGGCPYANGWTIALATYGTVF